MQPFKPTKIEWITFFTSMPVIGFTLYYLLFGDRHQPVIFWQAFPLIFLIGLISWYLHILVMHWLRIKFSEFKDTVLRLIILTVAHLSLITSSMVLFFYGFGSIHFLNYQLNVENFRMGVLLGISVTLVATSIWEGEYIFRKWKESLAEKELLEQQRLQNEFESLKSQVNPHFLFNCFNTLSSLITEDTTQAEKFLDEMSKVYRYLLRSNEDGLSTVQKELQFIRSYFQLLKSRYGNALEFKIEVDKKYETYLLPSLSLQLVIENAVKHNVVSKQLPLVIDIFTTTGNKLIVNNNLQLKIIKALSTGIGLENIKSKYDLLEHPGFQVLEDDKNFTVVLPLLWSKTSDNNFSLSTRSYI
ncbi:MAG: histidine kinase [Chitinophagaceae bacterium]